MIQPIDSIKESHDWHILDDHAGHEVRYDGKEQKYYVRNDGKETKVYSPEEFDVFRRVISLSQGDA